MDNFIYYTPTKIYFGDGQINNLNNILKEYNAKNILLHYGKTSIKKSGLYDKIINLLKNDFNIFELGGVEANPKLSKVLEGVKICKENKIDFILAVGGGSVLDSAKSIAAGSCVDFSPWKFSIKEAEVKKNLNLGAILTIAASGSDMSNSCVITNDETKEKRGFTSDFNRPKFTILDPTLTYSVSKYQTACGIVDIMMHTLERYISVGEDYLITDNISLGLLKAVYDVGLIAYNNPTDYNARATLLWANSLSHNGLTGCGRNYVMSVHQLEHELSGMYDHIAHGAGLAVLWPYWAKIAYKGAKTRFLRLSYEVLGISKTNDENADIEAGIDKLQDFFIKLGMPKRLRELNVEENKLKELAYNYTFKGKRILNDIITIDEEKALEIYKAAY